MLKQLRVITGVVVESWRNDKIATSGEEVGSTAKLYRLQRAVFFVCFEAGREIV